MAPAATSCAVRAASRGHSSPRKAAPAAASRPHRVGSPSASPTSAPSSVKAFQSAKTPRPVHQKPARASAGSPWAVATAVDSSIVSCAAAQPRGPRAPTSGAIATPYSALRAPSSPAVAAAATPVPPAPMTPTKANCDPPVNISRLSAQACHTLSPAATASAPNDTPYNPVAVATDSAWRRTARRRWTTSSSAGSGPVTGRRRRSRGTPRCPPPRPRGRARRT